MPTITSAGPSGGASPAPYTFARSDGAAAAIPVQLRTYEPAGVAGMTFPRWAASSTSAGLTSGTIYACAVPLDYGVTVTAISLLVAGTAEATGTHAWVGLADSGMNVLAVSADKTGAAYFGGTQTAVTTALAASFTTTYAGLHYVFVNVTATTTPVFASAPAVENAALSAVAPVLCGSSGTGQTTPPTVGTALTALTATAGHLFYAWLT
jgi:hypothetical protein